MRTQILFLVLSVCSFSGIGQNSEPDEVTKKWKLDSTTIAREKFLLNTNKDINQIKNDQIISDINTRNNEIKSNLTVFGDAKPTPLAGGITISAGTISTAETRLKVHKSLNIAINSFKDAIKNDDNIIVYSPTYFESIPHFKVAQAKLNAMKQDFTKLEQDSKKSTPTASILATAATAISLVNAVANLGMLFKTETQMFIKDEAVNESIIISKLIKATNSTKYYYPSLYPPNLGNSQSDILELINEIDRLKDAIEENIKKKKGEDLKDYQDTLDKLENELSNLNSELAKKKLNKQDTVDVSNRIIDKNQSIKNHKDKNKVVVNFVKSLSTKFDAIQAEYKKIKDALDIVIDKENNLTALGLFIKIENLIKIMNQDKTKILRVSATSKGTDQVKKSLWTTKLKNSAAVEIEYQLFDKNGVIVGADAIMYYEGFNGTSIENGKK